MTSPVIISRGVGTELFSANMDGSQWYFSGSRFQCELEHKVPRFGAIQFVAEAGLPLRIEIHSGWMRNFNGMLKLRSVVAPWESKDFGRNISQKTIKAPDNVMEDGVLEMAEELRKGRWIELDLQRQGHPSWLVRVMNVGFTEVYGDFNQCRANLLTMNFEQARLTRLLYGQGKTHLTTSQRKMLKLLVDYILEDAQVTGIEIDGHTDTSGQSLRNRDISIARANRVRDFLREQGVSKTMVVRGHGSRYPLKGQSAHKNRRVEIRLIKNGSKR
ncbi:OmpA family protein [Endozoicomonas sp. Mp262]|uniref:OmpA family protein n=1 Tax=Endozoicomonas sp. Mp262 TaxID=2919499 RepID=UPI0021D7F8AC